MTFSGLTDPHAVVIEDNHYVQFDNGDVIECQTKVEAEALAQAWRLWPNSGHPPVDQSRGEWRTGFADGAKWQFTQPREITDSPTKRSRRTASSSRKARGLLRGPGPVMGPSYDKATVEYVVALVNVHRAAPSWLRFAEAMRPTSTDTTGDPT